MCKGAGIPIEQQKQQPASPASQNVGRFMDTKPEVAADDANALKDYSAAEVAKHDQYKEKKDSWVVFRGKVYNISNFAAKHPGGWELITTYQGQDATTVMEQFHPDMVKLQKYLKPLQLGTCSELQAVADKDVLLQEFNQLTAELKKEGYFESSKFFFALLYLHIVALEALAYYLVAYHNAHQWGSNWFSFTDFPIAGFLLIAVIQGVASAQGAWLQHDAGHKSIFGTNDRLNFWAQQLTMGCLVGASTRWWKDRHSRHHGKTNIYKKDPDIAGRGIIVFGDVQFQNPVEYLIKPLIPYQAYLFVFAAVPSVTTWLFVRPILWHILVNQSWYDAIFMSTFYIKNYFLYEPIVGWNQLVQMYFGMRVVQSFIFVWVSQISHIPCEIINEPESHENFNWVQMQLQGTLNVAGGWFNDWFTGHLNYQIEHHLWPTMPRHYYPSIAPRVKELCKKHKVDYIVSPDLFTGCVDVVEKIQKTADNFTEHQKKAQQKKVE